MDNIKHSVKQCQLDIIENFKKLHFTRWDSVMGRSTIDSDKLKIPIEELILQEFRKRVKAQLQTMTMETMLKLLKD